MKNGKKSIFWGKIMKILILEPYFSLVFQQLECFLKLSEISAVVPIIVIHNVEIYSGDFGASPAMFKENWNSYESGFGNPAQVTKFYFDIQIHELSSLGAVSL